MENETETDLKREYSKYEKNYPMSRSMADHFYFYVKMKFLSKGWYMASLALKNIHIRKAWYLIKNFGELFKTRVTISFLFYWWVTFNLLPEIRFPLILNTIDTISNYFERHRKPQRCTPPRRPLRMQTRQSLYKIISESFASSMGWQLTPKWLWSHMWT